LDPGPGVPSCLVRTGSGIAKPLRHQHRNALVVTFAYGLAQPNATGEPDPSSALT